MNAIAFNKKLCTCLCVCLWLVVVGSSSTVSSLIWIHKYTPSTLHLEISDFTMFYHLGFLYGIMCLLVCLVRSTELCVYVCALIDHLSIYIELEPMRK